MTTKQKILKEFDEKFPNKIAEVIDDFGSTTKLDIFSFLSSTIDLIEKETREKTLKEVMDEMKKCRKTGDSDIHCICDESYNQARQQDKLLITNKLNQLK